MMMKWDSGGRNAPVKKIPYWAWAVLAMLYIMLWRYAIIHAQRNIAAASLPPVYEADVWPAAVIGGACAVLWGWWRKRGKNHS